MLVGRSIHKTYVVLIVNEGSRDIIDEIDYTGFIFFYNDIFNLFRQSNRLQLLVRSVIPLLT